MSESRITQMIRRVYGFADFATESRDSLKTRNSRKRPLPPDFLPRIYDHTDSKKYCLIKETHCLLLLVGYLIFGRSDLKVATRGMQKAFIPAKCLNGICSVDLGEIGIHTVDFLIWKSFLPVSPQLMRNYILEMVLN